MLNINSHLYESIEKGCLDLKNFWFANYLTANVTEGEGRVAQVTVFIRLTRRIETLDPQFISSRMYEYQLRSGGRATHLMEKVVYGAEMICSIEKLVDWEKETKESVERNLYLAVKDYFDHAFGLDSATTQLPFELNEATCNVFSSLEAGRKSKGSFQEFIPYLRDVIHFYQDERPEKWKPVEIVLRDIPAQIETRLWSEKRNEIEFLKEQYEVTWKWIVKETRNLSKNSSLQRFPPLEKVICQFQDLLLPFWKEIEKLHENTENPEQVLEKVKSISDFLTKMIDWLAQRGKEIEIFDWLLNGTQLAALDLGDIKIRMWNMDEKFAKVFVLKVDFNQNILVDKILELTGGKKSAFELPLLLITRLEKESLAEIRRKIHDFSDEADLKRGDPNRDTWYQIALVPISSLWNDGAIEFLDFSDRVSEQSLEPLGDPNDSLEKVQQNQPQSPSLYPNLHKITPGDVSSSTKQPQLTNEFSTVVQKDEKNKEEEDESMDIDSSMLSSDLDAGMEDTESYKGPASSDNMTNMFIVVKTETNLSTQEQNSYGITENHHQTQSTDNSYTGNAGTRRNSFVTNFNKIEIKDNQDRSTTSIAASIEKSSIAAGNQNDDPGKSSGDHQREKKTRSNSSCQEEETRKHHETDYKASESASKNNRNQEKEREFGSDKKNNGLPVHEEPPSNRNIGELFSTSRQYSQLNKKGRPNVYLLNAEEMSVGEDFRCFNIGQPEGSLSSYVMRKHKVIILMGATGCGKSTLINGMVNYILGVKWNDPFRFKCVRDDESTAKNQAHSQTSSVTAYTLRHHDGMAVPYSITIIDTPGYGDTRGVQRDKEITRKIHQFLTQQETRVDEIHAACFVAASGNSRLTPTQSYIIDSVLSIFGKDVKENIRLLVTFADNAPPPVVEACLAANFPVTSASAGITFSKFNSSVLYANNDQQGDDDFCFDELFWDMGQENFHKFFTMLEKMNGKDLKSTRNVIQSRGLLEQSLKDIEQELEICFAKIENMEIFQRKMRQYGHKMESNKNFTFEKTEMHLTKMSCAKGFSAYNCRRCRDTCERPIKPKNTDRLQKRKCDKELCPCPASEHEYQTFEWRLTPVKITTTLKDMKFEYESNYDRKVSVEQLLADNLEELNVAKAKVFSLLEQVGINARKLDSTALRSNALTPSDYLSMMKSRVAEEQAPGYLTRLETLTELQNCLAADASASASYNTARSFPNQQTQHRSSNTGGASHRGNYGSKTFQHSQPVTVDGYRTATTTTAGASSNYSSGYYTRAASGPILNQHNNQSDMTRRGTSDSKEGYSSDENKDKKGIFATFKGIIFNK
jgi:GTP-binding protein EngB required for normal cell division